MSRRTSPKPTSVSSNVDRSRLGSSELLTSTRCAGAVALASFSKSIRYGNVVSSVTKPSGPYPAGPVRALGSVAFGDFGEVFGPGLPGGLGAGREGGQL